MSIEKYREEKIRLHPRNKNREKYDLDALSISNPELKIYVKPNKFGLDSIDFSNPVAVRLLNKALLNHYYGINHWDFSEKNLCPPIPGRAEYIHHIADLLSENNFGKIPTDEQFTCLDVGVGASCIYPIIGVVEYGWNFIGSDIDAKSIEAAQNIVNANPLLKNKVKISLQKNKQYIFEGILNQNDKIDLVICNPPFHASIEDAQKGTLRKNRNLSTKKVKVPKRNFAGIESELIYEGGERQFTYNMIMQSADFAKNSLWFSTLVSKQANLIGMYKSLKKIKALKVKTIPIITRNKFSRIVAWTFFSKKEQREWSATRWAKPVR